MSDFLFARPSTLEGVASILDLFGTLRDYNYSRNVVEADERALYNDFVAVGQDLLAGIKAVEVELRAGSGKAQKR